MFILSRAEPPSIIAINIVSLVYMSTVYVMHKSTRRFIPEITFTYTEGFGGESELIFSIISLRMISLNRPRTTARRRHCTGSPNAWIDRMGTENTTNAIPRIRWSLGISTVLPSG